MEAIRYIKAYRKAARNEAIVLLVWAVLSIALVIFLLKMMAPESFIQGLSYAIIPMAIVLGFRSVRSLIVHVQLQKPIQENATLTSTELSRVHQLIPSLKTWRAVDQIILLVGFSMMLLGGLADFGAFMAGTGIGLTVQSTVLFLKDLWALWRAKLYLVELKVEQ